jgi:hypothetical protein
MTDPTATWREAMGSTSAQLRATQAAFAASQQDLTAARGTIVDLLYILDAFQVESGADRNASYETGIEAVRQLHADLAQAQRERDGARAAADELGKQRDQARAERDERRQP